MPDQRIWVQARGTIPNIPPVPTSLLVDPGCIIDDVKRHLREELRPLLDDVPKPCITLYAYNAFGDDYMPQSVTNKVIENSLPEILSNPAGFDPEHPLYFDYIKPKLEKA